MSFFCMLVLFCLFLSLESGNLLCAGFFISFKHFEMCKVSGCHQSTEYECCRTV